MGQPASSTFLTEAAYRRADTRAQGARDRAAEWLIAQAQPTPDGDALMWAYSSTDPTTWKWWCHGAPGIAVAFLHLYRRTGIQRYADVARRALHTHSPRFVAPNLSQCHGLSGIGDIYVEAYQVLGEDEWLQRAGAITDTLRVLARQHHDGGLTWLVQDMRQPTADLMAGNGGVVHFLLRYGHPKASIGLPLLISSRAVDSP